MKKLYTFLLTKIFILISFLLYASFAHAAINIKVNACVYLEQTPTPNIQFDFRLVTIEPSNQREASWLSQDISDVSLIAKKAGINCVSMGTLISAPTDTGSKPDRLNRSHIISYSSPGNSYSNSANFAVTIMGDELLAEGPCSGKAGMIQLSQNANSQLCLVPALCDNQSLYCNNNKEGEYFIIFKPDSAEASLVTNIRPLSK